MSKISVPSPKTGKSCRSNAHAIEARCFGAWLAAILVLLPSYGFSVTLEQVGLAERAPLDRAQSESAYIGRVNGPNHLIGTAVLIGPDLIVTAAHVISGAFPSDKLGESKGLPMPDGYSFTMGHSDDEVAVTAQPIHVWWGMDEKGETTYTGMSNDWAILKLDKPIGEKSGWMDLAPFDNLEECVGKRIRFAGHGSASDVGSWPTYLGSSIRNAEYGNLVMVAQPSGGDSGGPIYSVNHTTGRCLLYGIISCRTSTGGYAAPVSQFRTLLRDIGRNSARPSTNIRKGERYPQTSKKRLTYDDVRWMSYAQVRYAINEMFARHGASFRNRDIQNAFTGFAWYRPQTGLSFDEIENRFFSATERANLILLGSHRNQVKQ